MFGWRKRADGFEWHDYVRTTILVRRNERRQKIDKAREDAYAHAGELGRQGVEAAKEKISQAGQKANALVRPTAISVLKRSRDELVRFARLMGTGFSGLHEHGGEAVRKGLEAAGRAASRAGRAVSDAGGSLGQSTLDGSGSFVSKMWGLLSRGELAVPAGVVAVGAAAGAFGEYVMRGTSTLAILAIGLAMVCGGYTVFHSPVAGESASKWLGVAWRIVTAFVSRLIQSGAISATAVAAVIIGAGYWISSPPSNVEAPEQRTSRTAAPVQNASKPAVDGASVSGFARSITGDILRIGGTPIKLAGIEAPDLNQLCDRGNSRTWRCGQSALNALRRITGRNDVRCNLSSGGEQGIRTGTCAIGEQDIAAGLVANGHVFATPGFFAPYVSLENEAKAKKVGIWRGDAVRPSEYREQRWALAAENAPNGCPVKGPVLASRGKVYLMPWSRKYDFYKIREARGERWFCSEDEAIAAGWKSLEPL